MKEERRIHWDCGSPLSLCLLPTQLSLSVSHVNPLLFCLKFLIGAEGQIMLISSRSVEKYSLLIK